MAPIFGVLRQNEKLSEIKPPLKLKQDGIIALIACATIVMQVLWFIVRLPSIKVRIFNFLTLTM